jgi:kynurenine formamidase
MSGCRWTSEVEPAGEANEFREGALSGGNKRWTRRPEGSNWGDFGPDDQVGRLNLITPEMRRAALAEATEGRCFPLSLPLDYPGWGHEENAPRQPPRLFARQWGNEVGYNVRTGKVIGSDDHVVMSLQYSTQWDSLAHVGLMFDVDGSGVEVPVYYNGWRAHEHIVSPERDRPPCAHKLGIENMALTGVQGRGVMVDLVREYGRGRTMIGYDKMMRAIEAQKVEARKGDFLLLYTGYGDAVMAMNRQPDEHVLEQTGAALDGYDDKLLKWIDDSGFVAVIADNPGVEAFDPTADNASHDILPLHRHCLFKLGIHLGELFWLSELAAYLKESGRHAFLFTGPPLRLPGAVGSPVTPVATV